MIQSALKAAIGEILGGLKEELPLPEPKFDLRLTLKVKVVDGKERLVIDPDSKVEIRLSTGGDQ